MAELPRAYELLLPFDSDDPEFTRGVEVGRVWAMLGETDERAFTIHWSNAEMMLRVAESLGLTAKTEPLDETWAEVVFS